MTATVGVVIPIHDHAPFVAAAIGSVLTQTRPPDRLVVVDDGSRDGSLAVAERAAARHARSGVDIEVRGQANLGAAATLNRELSALGTDVVTVLNSDDEWHPERLARLLPLLDPDRPGLVLSDTEFLGADGGAEDAAEYRRHHDRILRLGRCLPSLSTALRLWNLAISTGNLVMTRRLWTLVGPFDTDLPIAHDWEFLLRASREVEPLLHPERLFRYRLHGANTSRTQRAAAGTDLQAVLQVQLAQGVADTRNPLSATARTLPTLLPFLVPLWESTLGPGRHAVPRLLGERAAHVRGSDGPDGPVLSASGQRRLAAELFDALRAEGRTDRADVAPALAAAAGWTARAATTTTAASTTDAAAGEAATFAWGARRVTVHAEDPAVLRGLATLTGAPSAPATVTLGRAELNAVGAHDVVTRGQLRTFATADDRLVWLALTLAEFLGEATPTSLHAAALVGPAGVVLVCGPPHAGKSTFAANAVAAGMDVLGDDQVELHPGGPDGPDGAVTVLVAASPRPLKLRARGPDPAPTPPRGGVRGRLDDEAVTLAPRPTRHDGAALPVAAVVHLRRSTAPGATLRPVDGRRGAELLAAQLRGPSIGDGVVAGLRAVTTLECAVGHDADVAALHRIAALARTGEG